ncbi:MAG: alanyl-tRNA editing protein [Fimbriimonadaceae bacterium]|nr:alanyl-tRNA editing protein [Alphaproteobacteria bacterium]
MTEKLFEDDAYLLQCDAKVVEINDRGGIILDRTVFYPTGGGQPGDSGWIRLPDDRQIDIATAVYSEDRAHIVHVPSQPLDEQISPGTEVLCAIDFERRHRHMRIHTALHLLSAVLPFPVTGGSISADGGRLDFDIQDAGIADKEQLTGELNEQIQADYPLSFKWITDDELRANSDLVKTMAVKPPMGMGKVRLIQIGDNIDLQPCGGTHVRSTGEIGPIVIKKIEKKGRQNRRVRIVFAEE